MGRRSRWIRLVSVLGLGMAAMAAGVLTGCTEIKTSAKDVVWVNPDRGEELVRDRETLLGLGKTETGVWVDARSAEQYRKGHIPGAISLPYSRVNQDHYVLDPYDVIVVYGNDYGDPKAEGMSKRLMELRHGNVRTLRGGLRVWKDSGREIETGADSGMAGGADEQAPATESGG